LQHVNVRSDVRPRTVLPSLNEMAADLWQQGFE
jgi:hypothetical protein